MRSSRTPQISAPQIRLAGERHGQPQCDLKANFIILLLLGCLYNRSVEFFEEKEKIKIFANSWGVFLEKNYVGLNFIFFTRPPIS
jgi:hypothetical protein